MNPNVSIIVPNYNHALFLQKRLDTIFAQTYQDFEVILLDDASTDKSLEILEIYKNHPKVSHFIRNKENSGSPFRQWKRGVDLAIGELIWIAESDDYSDENFLETMVSAIKEDIGICYAQSLDIDKQDNIIDSRLHYTNEFKPNIWQNNFTLNGLEFIKKYLLIKNVVPNASAVVFKKGLLDKDIFSPSLFSMRMCGDWHFWIKLSHKTNIQFINSNLNFMRNHSNMTRNHNSKSIKRQRILEEVTIRNYLFHQFDITSIKRILALYTMWFKLHIWKAVFTKDFYAVVLDSSSNIQFLQEYLEFKIKSFLKK